jgi:DNA-binding LytR/AlgR family response regulator
VRKITCLIVDDEPPAISLLESYVQQTPFLQLEGKCANAFEVMEILQHQKIEVLFMDIQMPGLTGIELSRTLTNHGPKIVFTTAFEQYAIEGFKVDAVDYLLKPFNYEEFFRAATKARDYILAKEDNQHKSTDDFIFVRSEYRQIKIQLQEVLYFEGLKDYVKIHLQSQQRPVLSLISLKTLEEQLSPAHFMRIHRSFIINLHKIDAVERGQVIIHQVPITIADNYKERFNEYLSSKSINF